MIPAAGLLSLQWRKSSYSMNVGGNCVEVAALPDHTIAVRDSKHPTGPALTLSPHQWHTFLTTTRQL